MNRDLFKKLLNWIIYKREQKDWSLEETIAWCAEAFGVGWKEITEELKANPKAVKAYVADIKDLSTDEIINEIQELQIPGQDKGRKS